MFNAYERYIGIVSILPEARRGIYPVATFWGWQQAGRKSATCLTRNWRGLPSGIESEVGKATQSTPSLWERVRVSRVGTCFSCPRGTNVVMLNGGCSAKRTRPFVVQGLGVSICPYLYQPDGGISLKLIFNKSRDGSKVMFGTPEVRLLSVSLFTQTTGQLWMRNNVAYLTHV